MEAKLIMTVEEMKNKIVFILKVRVSDNNYYVVDLRGSLSRNVQDSMLFFDMMAAESYSGSIESMIEDKINDIATIEIKSIALSSAIPKTAVECIPSL